MTSPSWGGLATPRGVGVLVLFFGAYVALFLAVPPIPLCRLGACGLSPRPEAFLLAAALAYGVPAILGVSGGVFAAALLYEAIHPTGTTTLDALVALATFLSASGASLFVLRWRPVPEGAVLATGVLTGLLTGLLGTYAVVVKGSGVPAAYLSVPGEALLPLNVAGLAFLLWLQRRRSSDASEGNL